MGNIGNIGRKCNMAQKVKFVEQERVRLPEGTGARIDAVLNGGELRSAFIRVAVEAELRRREAVREETGPPPRY